MCVFLVILSDKTASMDDVFCSFALHAASGFLVMQMKPWKALWWGKCLIVRRGKTPLGGTFDSCVLNIAAAL